MSLLFANMVISFNIVLQAQEVGESKNLRRVGCHFADEEDEGGKSEIPNFLDIFS